jgi:hypothetical protein
LSRPRRVAGVEEVERARARAALATLDKLVAGQATSKIYVQMFGGGFAATIRSIQLLDTIWKIVSTTPMPRLREVTLWNWMRRTTDAQFARIVLPWIEEQPRITRLDCDLKFIQQLSQATRNRWRYGSNCRSSNSSAAVLPIRWC